jgi:hypothetical protein
MAEPSKTGVPIGVGGRDSSQLALAAEDLIKAACTHVDSTSVALGEETVEGLKELSAGSAALKSSVDAKLNTLNQSISSLKEEMSSLKVAIDVQTKDQKLQWAITNADVNAFLYYDKETSPNREAYSTRLVRSILMSFRKGEGMCIKRSTCKNSSKRIEDMEKQFRDKLSQQIHDLLGHKPRITVVDQGYAIYYS